MIAIDLPWPSRVLSPNSRSHYMAKARVVKKYRLMAAGCTVAAGIRRNDPDLPQAIRATITFHAPDNRRRDLDGMLSSIKSGIDGIADILGVDDSKWAIEIRKAEPRKGGLVRVELEAA